MSKYKYTVVGAVNILLGILVTGLPLVQVFVIIPRLENLYTSMAAAGPSIAAGTYPLLGAVFMIGVVALFFGLKLLTGSEKFRRKFFGYGVASAIVSLILPGLFLVTMVP